MAVKAEGKGSKEEVIPNKRAKWKIRGDYRGSGARTFGRNSARLTRGWFTCVQTMKREVPRSHRVPTNLPASSRFSGRPSDRSYTQMH